MLLVASWIEKTFCLVFEKMDNFPSQAKTFLLDKLLKTEVLSLQGKLWTQLEANMKLWKYFLLLSQDILFYF